MADKKISALTGATTPLAGTEVLPIVQSGATVKVSVDNLTAGKTVAVDKLAVNGVGTPYGEIDLLNPSAGMNRAMMFTVPVAAGANNGMQIGLRREGNSEVISSIKWAFNDLSGGLGNYISINTGLTDQETLKCDSSQNVTITAGNLVIGTSGKGIDFSATPGTGTSELLADYEEGTWTPVDGSGAGLVFTGVVGVYTKVGRVVNYFGDITYPVTANGSGSIIAGLPFTSSSSLNASGNVISTTVNAVGSAVPPSTSVVLVFPAGSLTPPTNAALSTARIIFAGSYQV